MKPLPSIAILLTFLALIAGCSGTQKQPQQTLSSASDTLLSEEERLLNAAFASTNPIEKSTLYFSAAKSLNDKGLIAQADFALEQVDSNVLSEFDQIDYQVLALEIAMKSNDRSKLKQALNQLQLSKALQTTLSRQTKIVRSVASAYSLLDQPIEAAVLLADYEGVFGLQKSVALNEEIWLLLQRTETDKLIGYTYFGDNPNTIAWLDLARQVKLNQSSIDDQYSTLTTWLSRYPDHPAAESLPLELDLLSRLPETAPERIVLALPLSGPLSNIGGAIMDGFVAAHYQYTRPENRLRIETFDTASEQLDALYQRLAEDESGKSLVVGPITKAEVESLVSISPLPAATLALNNPSSAPYQNNLYLFGLDPEQEMSQISERMLAQGIRRVALIAPNQQRALRLSKRFAQSYAQGGGTLVSEGYSDTETSLAQAVANMLATSNSKQRGRSIARATGLSLETKPERRRDIEAILMIASPEEGKQIKPLLAFNFAQDVPVYATSSVHAPEKSDANNDLSQIQFPDIPWVFTQSNPLKSQIESIRGAQSNRYTRFYALGADAYLLAPRLPLLREISNSYAQGLTGKLHIEPNGVIERELQWAKYRRGKVVTLN